MYVEQEDGAGQEPAGGVSLTCYRCISVSTCGKARQGRVGLRGKEKGPRVLLQGPLPLPRKHDMTDRHALSPCLVCLTHTAQQQQQRN